MMRVLALLRLLSLLLIAAAASPLAYAHPTPGADNHHAEAHYLANEGIMIVDGGVKVLFDPLFDQGFGNYMLVPPDMKAKLMAGEPPYDAIDVVFVSHAHADHFAAEEMNQYLWAHPNVTLVAPAQAIDMMREASAWNPFFEGRIKSMALEAGDAAVDGAFSWTASDVPSALTYQAVRIPHAGGPGRAGIQNMVYRVTLNDAVTVMHLGDATPDVAAYAPHQEHWQARLTDTAFPPEWIIRSHGEEQAEALLNASHVIGVHVPIQAPYALRALGADFFSVPGETRLLTSGGE